MRAYMQTRAIQGIWAAGERLLVCVSPSPLSERLVRTTRRLADELNAEWIALYVETPQFASMSSEKRDRVASILQLAEDLGARSYTLSASNSMDAVSQTIIDFAHKNNVTKIVAGKPLRPRWQEILRGSLVDKLIHRSGDIDVYIVTSSDKPSYPADESPWRVHSPLSRYLWSSLLVVLATLIGYIVGGDIEATNLVMVYLLAVVIAAIYLGRGPAIFASILGVLTFDFLFVHPFYTFTVSDTEYIITFVGLFLVGVVISQLTARASEQADAARQREAETAELYDLSRDLASAADSEAILSVLQKHLERTFSRTIAVLLPEGHQLIARALSKGMDLSEEEFAVADWVYRHAEPAGRHTNTLPAAQLRYLPLRTSKGVVGVLGVGKANTSDSDLPPAQRRLMEAFANQGAQAIERALLEEQNRQIMLLQSAEKLQNALLNSISHDLRTPLVAITGALSALDENYEMDEPARNVLIENARGEADRLNRLVGNLLNMTRIESGAIKLRLEPGDVQDLIGTAIEQLGRRAEKKRIKVDVPANFPLVPMDFTLMAQVIVNLLENAIKYSPQDSLIEVFASLDGSKARLQILDRGVGIPSDDISRVFDKFYRVQRPESVSGTGLGLSISKGIVEAHGGEIQALNREGGGTILEVELPLGP
jgi:two-component system, OmpR family, sensor histidine kinase KdpD